MRALTYLFVTLSLLWIDVAYREAMKPTPYPYRVVRPEFMQATYKPESCSEVYRICVQRRRSERVRSEK